MIQVILLFVFFALSLYGLYQLIKNIFVKLIKIYYKYHKERSAD